MSITRWFLTRNTALKVGNIVRFPRNSTEAVLSSFVKRAIRDPLEKIRNILIPWASSGMDAKKAAVLSTSVGECRQLKQVPFSSVSGALNLHGTPF